MSSQESLSPQPLVGVAHFSTHRGHRESNNLTASLHFPARAPGSTSATVDLPMKQRSRNSLRTNLHATTPGDLYFIQRCLETTCALQQSAMRSSSRARLSRATINYSLRPTRPTRQSLRPVGYIFLTIPLPAPSIRRICIRTSAKHACVGTIGLSPQEFLFVDGIEEMSSRTIISRLITVQCRVSRSLLLGVGALARHSKFL